jgi:hypothetical protein
VQLFGGSMQVNKIEDCPPNWAIISRLQEVNAQDPAQKEAAARRKQQVLHQEALYISTMNGRTRCFVSSPQQLSPTLSMLAWPVPVS